MVDTNGNAQCRLPVALKFMSPKIIIPVGDTVQFRQHALSAVLMDSGLTLFGGGKLHAFAENINSRQLKTPVCTHGFPNRTSLAA